jgi:hypothetical protein
MPIAAYLEMDYGRGKFASNLPDRAIFTGNAAKSRSGLDWPILDSRDGNMH